ncbi:MAG TPA: universal stress protein [Verrucomicrobiae bacterium]|nr:universal stress protein [Verrucomicrobiae bacterium]
MAANIFLVPLDFSRGSEKALDHALKLARERSTRVIALHVVPAELIYPPTGGRFDFYGLMQRDARENFRKLAKRKRLRPKDCELALARGADFADIIVRHAKKLRASLIIMGSHGRTGLRRLLLGSVAERTLRYAKCPVLIVK